MDRPSASGDWCFTLSALTSGGGPIQTHLSCGTVTNGPIGSSQDCDVTQAWTRRAAARDKEEVVGTAWEKGEEARRGSRGTGHRLRCPQGLCSGNGRGRPGGVEAACLASCLQLQRRPVTEVAHYPGPGHQQVGENSPVCWEPDGTGYIVTAMWGPHLWGQGCPSSAGCPSALGSRHTEGGWRIHVDPALQNSRFYKQPQVQRWGDCRRPQLQLHRSCGVTRQVPC